MCRHVVFRIVLCPTRVVGLSKKYEKELGVRVDQKFHFMSFIFIDLLKGGK